jgi:large subunit ribosomal protein L35
MKAKSRKSVTRRFKITGTGKVLRRMSFGRHLRHSKSRKQIRKYRQKKVISGPIARRIKRMMAKA